jgi:deoxycytidine triphosphate deaminase
MNVEARFQGGVLSAGEIRDRINQPDGGLDPLISQHHDDNLRAARYDVRLARTGCRLPTGDVVPVDAEVGFDGPLILHSGDSAWISSYEQFCLPRDISGTVTLRADYANQGLLLLSGALIDPGYGSGRSAGDRRLHFFIANLGERPILLQPGRDSFASVQFFTVAGQCEVTMVTAPPAAKDGLGFIEKLKKLQTDYTGLAESVERGRDLRRNLILLGYFVLGTAIISASLATILSIGSNARLTQAVDRAVPSTQAGKALLASLVLSVAWVLHSAAAWFGPRRERRDDTSAYVERTMATRSLRLKARYRAFLVLLPLPSVACTAVWLGEHFHAGRLGFWPVWVVLVSAVVGVAVRLTVSFGQPPAESQIRAEMDRLASE